MELIILIIHLMIAIALVGIILMQQSEGGALGIGGSGGGGGGMSGFLTGRAAANILTRMTTILAAGFLATSMILAILAGGSSPTRPPGAQPPGQSQPAPTNTPKAPAAPK
jgi:preprotein translocase subunit SecG